MSDHPSAKPAKIGFPEIWDVPKLEDALKGDTELARFFAERMAILIEEGDEPLPPAFREFLANALRAGAAGKSVDQALGLKRRRGINRPKTRYERAIASLVAAFHFGLGLPFGDSEGWSKGKEPVAGAFTLAADRANEFGIEHPQGLKVSPDAAEDYWKKHRQLYDDGMGKLIALAIGLDLSKSRPSTSRKRGKK